MIEEDSISFAVDMTYGLLLFSGVALASLTDWEIAVGYMVGICLGYAVHAGSQIFTFSRTVADD